MSKIRLSLITFFISGLTLICSLLIMEVLFFFFVVQSDSFGFTLASQRWNAKYWTPINSMGFRDVEHAESEFFGKRVLFVVGDSLVAGYGIKDYRKRASGVLQKKLGEDWLVINIAKNGWNTIQEYEAIVSYPHKPDVIVLSYFINDIEDAAAKNGFYRPVLVKAPPRPIRPLVYRSHLFNFVYWRLYRLRKIDMGKIYWEYLKSCYSDEEIWKMHKEELLDIIDYSKNQGIELIVVVFPYLRYVKPSKHLTSKTVNLINLNGVRVIDLATRLSGRDPAELIVNRFDAHPNEKLNDEIACLLYEEIRIITQNKQQ